MKIRKFLFGGAFLFALTASFAFKAEKRDLSFGNAWLPLGSNPHSECASLLPLDGDDCVPFGAGAQCTVYYNAANPALPAYTINCQRPLNHQF